MQEDWKFSQSKLLLSASQDVHEGICLSLSYEWCKRKLAGLGTAEQDMAKAYPSMSQQRAFTDFKASGGNTQKWLTMLSGGDGLNCNQTDTGNWAAGSYAGCAKQIDLLPADVYVFVATGQTVAHAMTLSFGKDGSLFFDANYGQYSAPLGKIGADVENHLTTYYLGGVNFTPGYWRAFALTGTPTHV